MPQKFTFIYGLIDPRNKELRYIGKSDTPQFRLAKHIREAKRSTHLHRLAWIKGILDDGLIPELILLMQVPTDAWSTIERLLINSLGDSNYNLTNMADGGLGGSTARGQKRSREARRNISLGLKRFYADATELKESIREQSKKLWQDKEFQEKRDVALNAPDVKSRMSKSQKLRWQDQRLREKQSVIGKRNWQDPELRKSMTENIKARWRDPEYREKRRQAMLKSWAKRKGSYAESIDGRIE